MNVGSLFSGIGGFDLGLERAGMRVLWQCESDEFCRRVLARHWPGLPIYPDVSRLRAADVAPVDVLCGGFPCQDLSVAGKGAGIDGARSGLWAEYARLIGELRPRYVIVENVAALLGRGLGRVLGDLAALGFDAEWDCLPASAFGAPHRRDRLWIVAYPSGDRVREQPERDQRQGGPVRAAIGGDTLARDDGAQGAAADARADADSWGREGQRLTQPAGQQGSPRREPDGLCEVGHLDHASDVGDPERVGRLGGPDEPTGSPRSRPTAEPQGAGLDGRGWWESEPDVGRVAHGVPARVDRLGSLGNALVPQIAQWIGERIMRGPR